MNKNKALRKIEAQVEDTIALFPYVLIRVSGGSLRQLETLHSKESARIASKIHEHGLRLQTLKHTLSDALYTAVEGQTDSAIRVSLVNLRRDVFNGRRLDQGSIKALQPSLSPALYREIRKYVTLTKTIDGLTHGGAEIYQRELATARGNFKMLAKDDVLRKGLILSSQSLLKYGLPNYLTIKPQQLNKQARKTEQSLVKYLSRIYAKTSPFSTFTNLLMGNVRATRISELKHGDREPLWLDGETPWEVRSAIRLNNLLYKYLKELLCKNQAIASWLPLRPNPTLTKTEGHYLFLTNSNNVEAFQRIECTPILVLIQQVASTQQEGVLYKDVVQTLKEQTQVDEASEIEAYLDQLIAFGFLEFNLGVSGTDPDWDLKVCQRLSPLRQKTPLVERLIAGLMQMRSLSVQYGKADVTERQQVLDHAYAIFESVCQTLQEAANLQSGERSVSEIQSDFGPETGASGDEREETVWTSEAEEATGKPFQHHALTHFTFRPEQMFYEDTSLNVAAGLDGAALTGIIQPLHHLLQKIKGLEGLADERLKMQHFFKETYAPHASVGLLSFYENYYRRVKKPEAKRRLQDLMPKEGKKKTDTRSRNQGDKAPDKQFIVPAVETRRREVETWRKRFGALLQEQMDLSQTTDVIYLKESHIPEIGESCQVEDQVHPSFGVFVQLFMDSEHDGRPKLMAVVNGSFPGYGKMMSRFLHLFEEKITDELRQWNTSLAGNALFLEDCDASYFNANLHPPLLPYEVWAPGANNSLPARHQIAVTDLKVRLNSEGKLQLVHEPTQKRCFIFDLGFQAHPGRSELFQLLYRFTGARHISPTTAVQSVLQHCLSDPECLDEEIRVYPRLVYEERLILQRKTWHIPARHLPVRQPEETDWDYFVRMNQWRYQHNIPDQVFVMLFDRNTAHQLDAASRAKLRRDDYKPQYVCFKDPLLVNLLDKLLKKVPAALIIEEMLPNSQQLLQIGEEKRVTEFVIQWYVQRNQEPK